MDHHHYTGVVWRGPPHIKVRHIWDCLIITSSWQIYTATSYIINTFIHQAHHTQCSQIFLQIQKKSLSTLKFQQTCDECWHHWLAAYVSGCDSLETCSDRELGRTQAYNGGRYHYSLSTADRSKEECWKKISGCWTLTMPNKLRSTLWDGSIGEVLTLFSKYIIKVD